MAIDVTALKSASVPTPDDAQTAKMKKLEGAAKGFEALMISQMMKSVRESSGGGWLSDGDQTGEDQSMSMAEEQFAQTMANSGGLGLAKMVVKTMSHPDGSTTPPVTDGQMLPIHSK